ncbi:MAG: adenylate kinase [Clostridia bacterium]|nr:adenylate kinase [Clostridia bacterium]
MKIILLGAPGAGKGTQAAKISEKYAIPQISTGNILRANIKAGTALGKIAKSMIDEGRFVPDEVVIDIVKERLKEADCKNGWLLDGFPRTVNQANELEKFATIDKVINVDVPFDALCDRISGRRVCVCGETYHVSTLGGKTKCDKCGGELFQRADDNEETVKTRLSVYSAQTEPLIDYYKEKGLLVTIDGNRSVEKVFLDIEKELDAL